MFSSLEIMIILAVLQQYGVIVSVCDLFTHILYGKRMIPFSHLCVDEKIEYSFDDLFNYTFTLTKKDTEPTKKSSSIKNVNVKIIYNVHFELVNEYISWLSYFLRQTGLQRRYAILILNLGASVDRYKEHYCTCDDENCHDIQMSQTADTVFLRNMDRVMICGMCLTNPYNVEKIKHVCDLSLQQRESLFGGVESEIGKAQRQVCLVPIEEMELVMRNRSERREIRKKLRKCRDFPDNVIIMDMSYGDHILLSLRRNVMIVIQYTIKQCDAIPDELVIRGRIVRRINTDTGVITRILSSVKNPSTNLPWDKRILFGYDSVIDTNYTKYQILRLFLAARRVPVVKISKDVQESSSSKKKGKSKKIHSTCVIPYSLWTALMMYLDTPRLQAVLRN